MNEQVTLDIFHREYQEVSVGDIVATTTSEFDYNGITHNFDKEATEFTTIIAEHINEDYSEYDVDKCRNGGCYGYDFYKVLSIVDSEPVDVEFKVVLIKDKTIAAKGVLNTGDADDERPIQWYDYGLKWYFPNNPYDPDFEIADYNRFEELRQNVLSDSFLVQYLCDFAEEDVKIQRDGYWLIINGGE